MLYINNVLSVKLNSIKYKQLNIQKNCFKYLDAPVEIVGSVDTPAIPLNSDLEFELLTNATKVEAGIKKVLEF